MEPGLEPKLAHRGRTQAHPRQSAVRTTQVIALTDEARSIIVRL